MICGVEWHFYMRMLDGSGGVEVTTSTKLTKICKHIMQYQNAFMFIHLFISASSTLLSYKFTYLQCYKNMKK